VNTFDTVGAPSGTAGAPTVPWIAAPAKRRAADVYSYVLIANVSFNRIPLIFRVKALAFFTETANKTILFPTLS
jgi:hypothetical protein